MVVGQNPGRQRVNDRTYEVFHGNRTGDLVERAIDGLENIILTNVVNFQDYSSQQLQEGIDDLKELVLTYKPKKIICLGGLAKFTVQHINCDSEKIYIAHPSFVLRFNLGWEEYQDKLRLLCQ